ncbi:MAG: Methyltransferase type 11 [candidate division WWE3 bacterium GW2011_GWB1_44_4]|uniref:Methyltransferase type 11 n=2 Tax=Katanobacteria TaxID=422282 RepID=A0A0G1JF30_UNCKA|nr:MAG: Methyltransferase type 11 [candidate division WWE3 bacterium GW2011_GWB1_44_4]
MVLSQAGEYTPGREARWYEGNELILKLLQTKKQLRVLDVGSGETAGYRFLVDKSVKYGISLAGLEYHAVDNNPKIQVLLKDTGIIFHLADLMQIDTMFAEGFFDVIIASEIIEHLVDTDKFIVTLGKLLAQDGYIYLTTPNLASWHGRLMLLFGYQPLASEVSSERAEFGKGNILAKYYHGKAIMHVRVFTLRALLDFLKYHGFCIEAVWGGGYRKIDSLLFKKLFIGLSPIIKVLIKKGSQC